MARRQKSALRQRFEQMMSNLGALFGRLYGSGNSGSVVANQPNRSAASTRRKGDSRRRRKRRH